MSELYTELASRPLDYERIVVAVNPVATEAAKLAGAVEDNLRCGGLNRPVQKLETVAGGLQANQEHFARRLEPGDLVVTVSGDGGFRCVGAAALHPDLARYRRDITFTTVGGGDACDLKHALHGKKNQQSPTEIVRRGLPVSVRPLIVQVSGQEYPAFSYAGFGQSGEGSFIVNTPAYRSKNRLQREAELLLHAVFKGKAIEIMPRRSSHPGNDADYSIQKLGELTASISPYMARNGRFPIRHWEEDMFVMQIGPGALRTLGGIARLGLGRPYGGPHPEPALEFTTLKPLDAQFDGEPMHIPMWERVQVGRGDATVTMLASAHVLPPELRQPA